MQSEGREAIGKKQKKIKFALKKYWKKYEMLDFGFYFFYKQQFKASLEQFYIF